MQHVRFVKGRGTCGSEERNIKIWIDFRKSPRFSLTSPLRQEIEKSSRPVFTMCGEPCLLIQMTAWTGLTVYTFSTTIFEMSIEGGGREYKINMYYLQPSMVNKIKIFNKKKKNNNKKPYT